ncbi:MAG TPA: phage holin family protein [Terriglobales bacterium]|nr:phage holin family protein [Terriglobales bacterium]
MRMLVNWILSAIALLIVTYVVPGFEVSGIFPALLAAVVIGLFNATIGLFLKVVTFPLTVFTLGIFWFVVNAIVLKLAAAFVPGFTIYGFWPAFLGAIVLALINMLFRWLMPKKEED